MRYVTRPVMVPFAIRVYERHTVIIELKLLPKTTIPYQKTEPPIQLKLPPQSLHAC